MLDIQGTLSRFGYDPGTLKRYSERPVLILCDYCDKSHETLYCRYANNNNMTCGSKDCRNKLTEKTCLVKYGTKHHLASEEVKVRRKHSNIAKYGVAHIAQVVEIREKIKESNVCTYTEKDADGNSVVVEKIKKTHRARYGVDFAINRADIREKAKASTKLSCGVENPFNSSTCMLKAVETKIARYGTAHPSNCYGKAQQELADWLLAISGKEFKADFKILKGKEIDLYNEELRLGVEYCGLYWHTEDSRTPRDRNYHIDKFKRAKSQNVRLITVFEDEWVYRQTQVKNFLRSVLGANEHVVYARKCSVREIVGRDGRAFFDAHHIQGANNLGKYFAGLFYEDNLLAVMSFGRHHRKSSQLVLDRFAVRDNYSVVGGASKLFKFLLSLSGVEEVVSWSDNRWSWGDVYVQLGFQLEESLGPDYSYVDFSHNCRRLSKQSQRKSKTNCPANKTEKEFSNSKNLHRLWDCGKLRWMFRK